MENMGRWFKEATGVKESKGNGKISSKHWFGSISKTYVLCHAAWAYFKRDLKQLQNLETMRFRLVSPNYMLKATSTWADDLEQQKQMERMRAVVLADPYDPVGVGVHLVCSWRGASGLASSKSNLVCVHRSSPGDWGKLMAQANVLIQKWPSCCKVSPERGHICRGQFSSSVSLHFTIFKT